MLRTTAALAALLAVAFAPPALAQAPLAPTLSVDTFFAPPSGIADGDFSPTNIVPDVPAAVAVHGDRVYTVGRTGSSSSMDIGIIARRLDGTFDTGFDDDGRLVIPVAAGTVEDEGRGIVVLPDGRLRVLATTGSSTSKDVVVLGLEPDGDPDPAFGTGGKVVLQNPGNDTANRIALSHDGRLAITGGWTVSGSVDLFVALLEADRGGRVPGFGTNGVEVVNQGNGTVPDRGVDVVFRPGGGLLAMVGVDTPISVYLRAFQDNGDPDPSFAGGHVRLDVGGGDTSAGGLLELGGRYYASGSTKVGADADAFIARVNADGAGLQHRRFDMRGRVVGVAQAVVSRATDLVAVPGNPETLVVVGDSQYTTQFGITETDWAAAAFNGFDGDLAAAGYGDLVIPFPENGGLVSVAAAPDRSLMVAGSERISSDDGFGNARLLLDAEKECDLALAVADPAEIVFRGMQPAALGVRVTNVGSRTCGGAVAVPAPYRMTPVATGAVAPGATFVANAVPIAFDGVRRAEDVLPVGLDAAGDVNPVNNQAAAHVLFSFCDLALEPVGRAGAVPSEGRRRFPVTLRNSGTIACRVRVGSKPRYSLASGQSVADRVPAGAPRAARPGTRVAVVLRAGATDDVNPVNDAATVRPVVVGVGDTDVRSRGARGFAGSARKGTGPLARKRLRPVRVDVALLRKSTTRCAWLRSARGGFKAGKPRAGGGCSGRRWVRAQGTKRWRLRLAESLPPGRYSVFSRATIGAGFAEARFSARDRNRVEFRVR